MSNLALVAGFILLLIALVLFLLTLLQVAAPPGTAASRIDKPMLAWFCITLWLLIVVSDGLWSLGDTRSGGRWRWHSQVGVVGATQN